MKETALWRFILDNLKTGNRVALLMVLQSQGSSPGRAGFKMALCDSCEMSGSIGGGIMEHKLVETARKYLNESRSVPVLKRQIHSKTAKQNQSGMICSGEQTVAIYILSIQDLPVIKAMLQAIENCQTGMLQLTQDGIVFLEKPAQTCRIIFKAESETVWEYSELFPYRERVYIVGGGHVSLALSRVLTFLDFEVRIFDDRPDLNTLTANDAATAKFVINYSDINQHIQESEECYVVIMTVGFRTDKIVLEKLLGRKFKYLGLLGSEAKIKQLFSEFLEAGVAEELLKSVHAPIGISISSKTPEEIAVSIAAQIIQVKNNAASDKINW